MVLLLQSMHFLLFIRAKGGLDKTPLDVAFGSAFGIGAISALITLPLVPRLKNYVSKKFTLENEGSTTSSDSSKNDDSIVVELNNTMTDEIVTKRHEFNIKNQKELDKVISIHKNAEKFDTKTEEVFKYLQIFTAICDAFSHGANDVANAIGPFCGNLCYLSIKW